MKEVICLFPNHRSGDLKCSITKSNYFSEFESLYSVVQYLNAIWLSDSRTIWTLDNWTPSCFLMYWSGIQKHIDLTFEYPTIWNPYFKTFGIQMVGDIWVPNHLKSVLQNIWYSNGWYSDPHFISRCSLNSRRLGNIAIGNN